LDRLFHKPSLARFRRPERALTPYHEAAPIRSRCLARSAARHGLGCASTPAEGLLLSAEAGVVGHEAIATIANVYLHDEALERLKEILPEWTASRLAPVAACPSPWLPSCKNS
jgi:hypothetical protein